MFEKSNDDRSRFLSAESNANILDILITFEVSKLDKSTLVRDEQF